MAVRLTEEERWERAHLEQIAAADEAQGFCVIEEVPLRSSGLEVRYMTVDGLEALTDLEQVEFWLKVEREGWQARYIGRLGMWAFVRRGRVKAR